MKYVVVREADDAIVLITAFPDRAAERLSMGMCYGTGQTDKQAIKAAREAARRARDAKKRVDESVEVSALSRMWSDNVVYADGGRGTGVLPEGRVRPDGNDKDGGTKRLAPPPSDADPSL